MKAAEIEVSDQEDTSPLHLQVGLVYGKFAPPHKGHVNFINKASARCALLIIMGYSAPTVIDESIYENTIENRLFILEQHLDAKCGYEMYACYGAPSPLALQGQHNWYKAGRLNGVVPDLVFCNEIHGYSTAKFFGAELVRLDPKREEFPVSSTDIRNDPRMYDKYRLEG